MTRMDNYSTSKRFAGNLVMKEPVVGERHSHAVFIACFDDLSIHHTPAGLHDVGDAQLGGVVETIAEREEGVAGETDARHGVQERTLLFSSQHVWHLLELRFPFLALNRSQIACN
jgi:hypothetical protein